MHCAICYGLVLFLLLPPVPVVRVAGAEPKRQWICMEKRSLLANKEREKKEKGEIPAYISELLGWVYRSFLCTLTFSNI